MDQGEFVAGKQILLKDHGSQTVDGVHQNTDGGVSEAKTAKRRTWTVERVESKAEREQYVVPEKLLEEDRDVASKAPVIPFAIFHNGESIKIDPSNAGDVVNEDV